MADLAELQTALVNADKAGDSSAAQTLAAEILRMQGDQNAAPLATASAPERFNLMQKRMGLGKKGNTIESIRDAVDNAGYNAGAKVTDVTGSPELGYLSNVAVEAVPMLLGGEVSKLSAAPKMISTARGVMQSAVKPLLADLKNGKAAKAIDTMLEGGFNATKGGVEAMKAKISGLNDEIEQAISSSTARVDKAAVADRLRGLLSKFEMQVNPGADTRAIQGAWDEFLGHPLLTGSKDMSVQLAQKMKQGTYKALGNKSYGELKGAETEAQKALARGLKEEISTAVPSVAPLNAKESELINAANVAERRALLQDNNNLGGLVWLAHDPVAAAGFMADKSGLVKSLIARGMFNGSRVVPQAAGNVAGGIIGHQIGSDEGILGKRTAWKGSEQGAQ